MQRLKIIRPMHIENIVIESESQDLMEHIAQFYGAYAYPSKEPATFFITEDRCGDAIIIHPEGTTRSQDALLFISDYLFDHTVIQEDFFAVHAAAVSYNDKAYILAAPTGVGKTTLTAWLVQNGFSYITDDCVIIKKDSLFVFPFSKPLHLREGGIDVLNSHGLNIEISARISRSNMDRFIWNPSNIINYPVPVGGVFFISRDEQCNKSQVAPLRKSIAELMKSPITHYTVNSEYLAFLSKLAGVGCSTIQYSDMCFVAEAIKQKAAAYGSIND